jgi:hypothetical protein
VASFARHGGTSGAFGRFLMHLAAFLIRLIARSLL